MPRTITRTVYSYSELSQKAKDKAREWYQRVMSECRDYTDRISENFKMDLESHGLKSLADKCYWSLSYCQGDGVAFYGRIDNDDFAAHDSGFKDLLARFAALDPDCSVYIMVEGEHGNYHSHHTMRVSVEHDSRLDAADTIADEIREYVSQYLKDLSREFERNGYAEIEFMDSEEYFTDACDANEWEFYADGKLASGDGE